MNTRNLAILFFCATLAFSQGIPGVIAANAKVELVQEGFNFLEGPIGAADGGLYFTDIQGPDKIFRLAPDGKITQFREKTNGVNGQAYAKNGDLLGVEGSGKRVIKSNPDGTASLIYEGMLAAPNDLIVDSKGGIYFTDPGPRPVVPGRKVFVYYLPAGTKQAKVIDDQVGRPNGLTLSNDGKTLFVDDTIGENIYAYDVLADGSVRNRRIHAKMHDYKAGSESGADGLAIDRAGRLYVTSVSGVQVFDKKGEYLGTITVPRQPANVAFAGPNKKTLYIAARQGLYKVQLLSQGPKRLGK